MVSLNQQEETSCSSRKKEQAFFLVLRFVHLSVHTSVWTVCSGLSFFFSFALLAVRTTSRSQVSDEVGGEEESEGGGGGGEEGGGANINIDD